MAALVTGACTRTAPPPKAKGKAATAKKAKSYVTPAKFHIILAALAEADTAFMRFWTLQNPSAAPVTSPFQSISLFLKSHQKEDHLNGIVDQCPKFKSRLRITQDNSKDEKPISGVVLDATEKCEEKGGFQNIARFDFENSDLRVTIRTAWFADGFGKTLASQDKQATCDIRLNADQKLQTLKCQGLGQDEANGGNIELSNFEFTADTGTLTAQGTACAGTDPQCQINMNTAISASGVDLSKTAL